MVRAQLQRVVGLAGAAGDRDGLEAHRPRPLHAEMAESADAEHRDEVAGYGPGAAQRVERGHAGAAQRRGLDEGQLVGDAGQRRRGCGDRFGVTARVAASWAPAG